MPDEARKYGEILLDFVSAVNQSTSSADSDYRNSLQKNEPAASEAAGNGVNLAVADRKNKVSNFSPSRTEAKLQEALK